MEERYSFELIRVSQGKVVVVVVVCGGVVAIRRNDVGPPVPVSKTAEQAADRREKWGIKGKIKDTILNPSIG